MDPANLKTIQTLVEVLGDPTQGRWTASRWICNIGKFSTRAESSYVAPTKDLFQSFTFPDFELEKSIPIQNKTHQNNFNPIFNILLLCIVFFLSSFPSFMLLWNIHYYHWVIYAKNVPRVCIVVFWILIFLG